MLALNARDLSLKWQFDVPAGVNCVPALKGTQLSFGDQHNTLYMFDTRDAINKAEAGQPPEPAWTWAWPKTDLTPCGIATPVLADGKVYAACYSKDNRDNNIDLVICNAHDGSDPQLKMIGGFYNEFDRSPPVLGRAVFKQGETARKALFVDAGSAVYAVDLEDESPAFYYRLPGDVNDLPYITAGFAYDGHYLWFGDNKGVLYSLDDALKPANQTPHRTEGNKDGMTTVPVIYKGAHGDIVLFGLVASAKLHAFDPANGNVATLPTGTTEVLHLSKSVTNGTIYAGGAFADWKSGDLSQVFGIRVDALPQALRDFVIDSQLMQDPDESLDERAGLGALDADDPIPPSAARYQTHLSVVDDEKTPIPNEGVKVWADKPNTPVTINGRVFTIGPDDSAAVKTDIDGSLTIVSDATDYFASTLRVWATFMNPFERIVIHPDQTFHARVTTAHADAGDDDPDKINLVTAKSYVGQNRGQRLFNDEEQKQHQPKHVANAIQQMARGLGTGDSSKGTFARQMGAPSVTTTPARDKYLAYDDLTGVSHFATNIPAQRLATIKEPLGLGYWRWEPTDTDGPNPDAPPIFVSLSHADAAAAIDVLDGQPWQPPAEPGVTASAEDLRLGNIWTDFWNWIKGLVRKITHIIISIGEEIYVGIRWIEKGVAKVFRAVIRVIDNIAAAIGSFFKMLEKAIEDVIAALSVFFHFGEIMKTQRWLAQQVVDNLKQVKTVIQTHMKPGLDRFFKMGEDAIKNDFDQLKPRFDKKSINDQRGDSRTPHSVYSVGPPGGHKTSHAVHCSWATHKLKTGLSTAPAHALGAEPAELGADPLTEFFENFVQSLTDDPTLKKAFSDTKKDFSRQLHPGSAGDFFKSALVDLLDILEDLLIGALAVSKAFVDGLLGILDSVIDLLVGTDKTTGILNTVIEIPLLSWLYKTLFNEPLTFLNLVTLVAAIPVTIVYRALSRAIIHPLTESQPLCQVARSRLCQSPQRPPESSRGCSAGSLPSSKEPCAQDLVIMNSFGDEGANAIRPLAATSLVLGVAYAATYFPLITNRYPDPLAWAGWSLGLALAALSSLVYLVNQKTLTVVSSFIESVNGAGRLTVFIVSFAREVDPNTHAKLAFARNFCMTVPPIINPVKLLPEPAVWVVAGAEVVAGFAIGGLDIALAFVDPGSVSDELIELA